MKRNDDATSLKVRKFMFATHSIILLIACLFWSSDLFVLTGVIWCLLYGGLFFTVKKEDDVKMSTGDVLFYKGGYIAHMIVAGIIIWSYATERFLITAIAGAGIGLFWSVILFLAYRSIKKKVNRIEEELHR